MSTSRDKDTNDSVDFSWGKKKGRGGKGKDVQFYESFQYDGVEYSLYDCVYLCKDEKTEPPYVGKLVKIWEVAKKQRKVKVLWFFHPFEISNYLEGVDVLENELFLASGDGKGLCNLNPLDRSKWFAASPWEDRLKEAHDQEKLVFLQNLDPTYNSSEVENIIWHGFGESCTAHMVQHTATSSRHSGQAFAIFKSREVTQKVLMELNHDCLMLPNGRPLVGSIRAVKFSGKQPQFFGHLVLDKIKQQMQKESREAVSTSHSSQSNTLEYEMALEWRLLQDRSDLWWKRLYKQQGEDMKKLKASLKSK